MKNHLRRMLKNEDGQALVFVTVMLVVLIGFAALIIDAGMLHLTKTDLQNAADAAALAAAQDLPDTAAAIATAKNYAEANGVDKANVTVSTPYNDTPGTIEVVVTQNSEALFSRVLGSENTVITARAVAKYGIAASVPWIVPFVIPKPPAFNYDSIYVMRMYGAGPYGSDHVLPKDFIEDSKYKDYTSYTYTTKSNNVSLYKDKRTSSTKVTTITRAKSPVIINKEEGTANNRWYNITYNSKTGWVQASNIDKKAFNNYPYQFDYMNVKIDAAQNFNDYLRYLEKGYHKTYSVNDDMGYYAPSSGGKESVDTFAKRVAADTNKDYTKAKVGDPRVMLIPVVRNLLPRNTRENTKIRIIGFAAFYLEKVYKNDYGESFWFEGRFLENLNIGTGQTTIDPDADFGLRVLQLIE